MEWIVLWLLLCAQVCVYVLEEAMKFLPVIMLGLGAATLLAVQRKRN
jgi:hypothetical protein